GPGFDGTGDPIQILYVWNGGLGIWGAIALGRRVAWIACRRYGLRLTAFGDVVAPGILLAQAIGRWGNCSTRALRRPDDPALGARGRPGQPELPGRLRPDTLFHPTFLYECL
ncbi:prolipoprotein diacylglyceryl transferase, partial [Rhodococcus hoagii]|nr:prolipoprotein diacylglyceryl transferase [Prescottella equi]